MNDDSPTIAAALAVERRFGAIEGSLGRIEDSLERLVERVGIQNGRVTKLEDKFDSLRLEPQEFRAWKAHVDQFIEEVKDEGRATKSYKAGQESITKRQWVVGGAVLTAAISASQYIPNVVELLK